MFIRKTTFEAVAFLMAISMYLYCSLNQGQIQDFLKGGSNLQRGFDLLIVPNYLQFFLILLKTLHENGIALSQRGGGGLNEPPSDPLLLSGLIQ